MNLPLFLAWHLVAITFPFILLMCNHFPIHLSQLQSLSLSSLLLNHFPFNFTHVQSLSHSCHSFSITHPFILIMCNHFPFHPSHLQSISSSSHSFLITFPFISAHCNHFPIHLTHSIETNRNPVHWSIPASVAWINKSFLFSSKPCHLISCRWDHSP